MVSKGRMKWGTQRPNFQSMGMKSAFGSGANFSGTFDSSLPENALYVSLIMHKAFVEVNEEGTEAAAASATVLSERSAKRIPPFTPTFRADHSFIYVIRDVKTGTILFLGRFTG